MAFMDKIKNSLLVPILSISIANSLAGCNNSFKDYESVVSHETATVLTKKHIAGGSNGGYPVLVLYPESNIIIFDGKVDFELDDKSVYEQFEVNDKVGITYSTVFERTFRDIDGDGVKDLAIKEFSHYEFITATKLPNQ